MNIELTLKLKIKDQEIELTEDEVQDLILQLEKYKRIESFKMISYIRNENGLLQPDPIEGWKIT